MKEWLRGPQKYAREYRLRQGDHWYLLALESQLFIAPPINVNNVI